MKDYVAILLVLLFPFALASCGGSSDGEEPDTEQEETPPSATPEVRSKIFTFSDESNLTPNVGLATEEEMLIVLGSDVEGEEMPLKSMILQKNGLGSLLVEFSASGMPSAFITSERTIKINKYSYSAGKWFMHFSVSESGALTDQSVELPQSFGEYVSSLDSWMRNRSGATTQLSVLSTQNQSGALKDSFASMLEIAAIGVEMGACAVSAGTANPGLILWACQSAVSTTIDLLDDGELTPPTNRDTQNCFFGFNENGISFFDPVCMVSTGLRIAADQLRGEGADTSEMEGLTDKSMDENRFIGEDPVIEEFPTPLLTSPQLAIISPQWRETFTSKQDVRIQVAASEDVEVIDYEVRSKESGAFLISGNTGKTPSGNFQIDIAAESLEPGTYFVTVSATSGDLSTQSYSSFVIANTSWIGTLEFTEEVYISGENELAGRFACQTAFSVIRRAEFNAPIYGLSLPSIAGETLMRVDSTFGGAGSSPYCTQSPVTVDNNEFEYVTVIPEYNGDGAYIPTITTSFSFSFDSKSETMAKGTMTATAENYDTRTGWSTGSCTAKFQLEKRLDTGFNACDIQNSIVCQPGDERCEWRNP